MTGIAVEMIVVSNATRKFDTMSDTRIIANLSPLGYSTVSSTEANAVPLPLELLLLSSDVGGSAPLTTGSDAVRSFVVDSMFIIG